MRNNLVVLALLSLWLVFQNCVGKTPVSFLSPLSSVKSQVGGGPYEGKPGNGYYCRIFDELSCQPQVKNLQSLVRVDDAGIHLTQDNCLSTSVNFLSSDSAVEYSPLVPNFIGLSRGIFKRCELTADNIPVFPNEMTDAYCVSHQDKMAVVVTKNLSNQSFSFDLFFSDDSQSYEVLGEVITKRISPARSVYASSSREFSLEISSGQSQTTSGQLKAVIDDRPVTVELNCRVANSSPTVIVKDDLEISPTWMETSSLVGYWKFNESNAMNGTAAVDSSKYASHGALVTDDGSAIKSDSRAIGGAFLFDGNGDSVEVLDPADGHLAFGLRSFTYMVWIQKTGNSTQGFDSPIHHGGSSVGVAGYDIECGSGQCRAIISDGLGLSTSKGLAAFTPSGSSLIGRWVLLTAVVDRDRNQLRAYLDGVLTATTDISSISSIIPGRNLTFGGAYTNKYFFMGLVDDISIWSKALSEIEIQEIFRRLRPKFY